MSRSLTRHEDLFLQFPPVVLHLVRGEECTKLRVGDGLRVEPVAGLYAELKALLGESCIGVGG